jgi:ApaG protein
MSTTVTHDIRVTARSRFEPAHSDPRAGRFLFSYRITITNSGRETVQLQRRHWIIRDSLAPTREVEGAGVVGETPVLRPGDSFTYSSACDLKSGFGRMDGSFQMVRTSDDGPFDVAIPELHLHFPHSCN